MIENVPATKESWLERTAGSSPYGFVVAGLATLTAVMASFGIDDIKNVWNLHEWPGWEGILSHKAALIFWMSIALWGPLYFVREHVKGKQIKRLHRSAVGITEALQTLPPSTFVHDYSTLIAISDKALGRVLPRKPREAATSKEYLAGMIREVLLRLGALANTYDSRNVDYGVNVMVFVRCEEKEFNDLDQAKIRRFLPPGFDLKNLEGVLHSRPEMSVTCSDGGSASPSLNPTAAASTSAAASDGYEVIFGIPKSKFMTDHRGRWCVLPGSPTALAQWDETKPLNLAKAVRCVHDFKTLRTRESERHIEYDLHPDVLDALGEDYGENGRGQMVRSFLAFPLVDQNNEAVGTLNIHCNKPAILGNTNESRITNFTAVVSPVVNDIATLVSAWKRAT